MLARANIFLAGIIEILFSFVLRPSQAMAGNNAFRYEHAIDGAMAGLFQDTGGRRNASPKIAGRAFSSTIRTESTVTF
jgi:hypothetical protein